MKLGVLPAAVVIVSAPMADAGQTRRALAPRGGGPQTTASMPAAPPDRNAQAYEQFLRARALRGGPSDDAVPDLEGAVAAYKRGMALDPTAADIPADLAELYMESGRLPEAVATAEQALKVTPGNRTAHRVLGLVYSEMANGPRQGQRGSRPAPADALPTAILHLEQSIESPPTFADFSARARLAQLYLAARSYDKAIALLPELVKLGWEQGASYLVDAYKGAGRGNEGLKWLEDTAPDHPELYNTLGEVYAGDHRWAESATAYESALRDDPRSFDLRVFMASSLLQVGSPSNVQKARDVLREAVAIRATDERALYLLSQAERRSGDAGSAEGAARRLVSQNSRNPRGYFVLAEALEDQQKFQAVVDALAPAMGTLSGTNDSSGALGLLLPHLGFAYHQLGQFDKAVTTFEQARKVTPDDFAVTMYLIESQMGAKNYSAAAGLAHEVRAERQGDLRLVRLESLALRRSGKVDQGLALLEDAARAQSSNPQAAIILAQGYLDANRGAQATKVLRDAQVKFPDDSAITLQLGSALEKQKKYAESEAILRQLVTKEPNNAIALNSLGYMLADRGERLSESVEFLKRAVAIDPDNGSYLDSIGWAYFKDGKLDLAVDNLKRAAGQLTSNSVVQDHYGDVLFKLGRYDEAIVAWNRALGGDGEEIVRPDIDKKIRSARQKLPKR